MEKPRLASGSSRRSFFAALGAVGSALYVGKAGAREQGEPKDSRADDGLVFEGTKSAIEAVTKELPEFFRQCHLPAHLLEARVSADGHRAQFTLLEEVASGDTLKLQNLPRLWLQDDEVAMPGPRGTRQTRLVVSTKEIFLSLLVRGRVTRFTDSHCSVAALRDHIGVRQNIVAWARHTEFQWPDGEAASWNRHYWHKGTPHRNVDLHQAYLDVLVHPERYGVGCYTAAKLILSGGLLDYYSRVAPNARKVSAIKAALWSDGDPLVNLEPQSVWAFEPDYNLKDLSIQGKMLDIAVPSATHHFVPGDWVYFWNTDPITYQKVGYEGSNAIYLGNGRFSDYYNDNSHSFTFEQKLDDVYQWRHGVFSRQRDFEKARPLSLDQVLSFANPPEKGGCLMPWRLVPRHFESN